MKKVLGLFALNYLATVVCVLLSAGLFYIFSIFFNLATNKEGLDFVFGDIPSASGRAVEQYMFVRNIFLIVGAVIGLVCSQVGFVLAYLTRLRNR